MKKNPNINILFILAFTVTICNSLYCQKHNNSEGNKKEFYINGIDTVYFNYNPNYLSFTYKTYKDSAKLDSLFSILKLERIGTTSTEYYFPKFYLVKKKNGSTFKKKNCKELQAIRESGLVNSAGPTVRLGYFTNVINIKFNQGNDDKIIKIIETMGLKYTRKIDNMLIIYTGNNVGYGIIDIEKKIIKHPEIKEVEIEIMEPNKLF